MLKNTDLNNPFTINEVANRLSFDVHHKLDDLIIEGLKRKGFAFGSNIQLETFVKHRCRCMDHATNKERTFYVDDVPFFLHKYELSMDFKPVYDGGNVSISADLGYYAFL